MSEAATEQREKAWVNILFLTLTPVIAVGGTLWHAFAVGVQWWMPVLAIVMYLLVGMSICAGYHRLFSHRAYEASPAVQAFFAVFGALAAQNSILWWSASHRVHHRYVDRDWDPYNIKRGFWWAHFLWIFYKSEEKPDSFDNVKDLAKSPVVMWQHRNYMSLLVGVGFGLPILIGALMGDWLGGLLWGGFVRTVVIHHTTFFVNSLAHTLGEQTFDANQSARDNWLVALLTLGEGYHSFHHRFPSDFRNGIRWYHWDPAKWFIRGMQWAGQAWSLRKIPVPAIEQAKMEAVVRLIGPRLELAPPTRAEEIRAKLAAASEAFDRAVELWKQQAEERAAGISRSWKETRREAKRCLRQAKREWREAFSMLSSISQAA